MDKFSELKEHLPAAMATWQQTNGGKTTVGWLHVANPDVISALLAELEEAKAENTLLRETGEYLIKTASDAQQCADVAEKRIAELDASETQLIQERDEAEIALADMYEAATGRRPEWSNCFGFADAVEEVERVCASDLTFNFTVEGDE
ncbi:hypothetical protein [Serratia sp. PAMC26656]|uniref:hypothetical protein n=1 Tax=Serratia sp. PAMC26656 TaxID=2775909 RepID=UPI00351CA65C